MKSLKILKEGLQQQKDEKMLQNDTEKNSNE
jgi:hypothetical protein